VHAARAVASRDGDLFIAGGVESMTRGPYVMSKPGRAYGTDSKMYDSSFGWRFINPKMQDSYGTAAMGETAENLVEAYSISREDQDAFAVWSQEKTAQAQASGYFEGEIVPVSIPQRKKDSVVVSVDEFPKPNSSLTALAGLRPAFRKDGSVTAGNSSGLNDGAAACLVASEAAVQAHGLTPLARIVASAVVGVEPRTMGIGPVSATQKVLAKAGLSLDDMDIIELNEAFAAQVLACSRALGLDDRDPRINPNGGSIAIGHPLGMSGARLALTAARQLKARKGKYALVTMCVGVGQGYAVILANPEI
jgi:acetyl-CoA acetyltransferase family protein